MHTYMIHMCFTSEPALIFGRPLRLVQWGVQTKLSYMGATRGPGGMVKKCCEWGVSLDILHDTR